MTIYICETLYHVMIASLVAVKDESIIICTTHEKKNMNNFRALNISSIPNLIFVLRSRNNLWENLGVELIRDRFFLRNLQRRYNFTNFCLVNFAWSVNSVDRSSAYFYNRANEVYFFEEGANGAIGIPQTKKKLLIKKAIGIPVDYHNDNKIKAVFVQNPMLYDERFKKKIKQFSLFDVFEKSHNRDNIIRLFLTPAKSEALMNVKNKIIVFTQPFSEDGCISEEKKLEIYREICSCFGEGRVILKRHPRDTSNYEKCSALLLTESFPSELLTVLNVNFKLAIGICTSAVNTIHAEYKVNLNNDFLKDKKFDISMLTGFLKQEGIGYE